MDRELLGKIVQGEKAVAGVKAFLILPMAALHLSVMARGIGTDEFMTDTQRGGGGLK